MIIGTGELAAFGTACAWAVSSYTYSMVGRGIGSNEVSLLRLPFQLTFVGVACFLFGSGLSLSSPALLWLVISGVVGAAFGDLLLYRSIMIIGPALGILLLSLNACFTALFGWLFLDELLSMQAVAGIALATFGVACAVTGRSETALFPGQEVPGRERMILGTAMALAASVFVAVSFIFLKMALREGADPLDAAAVRILASTICLWGAGLFTGWSKRAVRSMAAKPALLWTLTWASLFGGGGMWLSSLSMKTIPTGIAATIIALQPILVTFLNAVLRRRAPSARIVAGSLAAFLGTALVCLR